MNAMHGSRARSESHGGAPASVSSALRELMAELEECERPPRPRRPARAPKKHDSKRVSAWPLALLAPLVAASMVFRAEAPRLLGIEPPPPAERRVLLAAERDRIVEEIEVYLEEHGALVANLDAIDAHYGRGVRFSALSDWDYRVEIRRDGETVAYDSTESAGEER